VNTRSPYQLRPEPIAPPEEVVDWRPIPYRRRRFTRRRGRGRTVRPRIYALPVLLVVCAIHTSDTLPPRETVLREETGTSRAVSQAVAMLAAGTAPSPAPKTATAVLPEGRSFSEAGEGTWTVLPGEGATVGHGRRLYTYTIEVESGIEESDHFRIDDFAQAVDRTLADERSWIGQGQVSLKRVDATSGNPDFRISLTTPHTAHQPQLCGFQIPYESSCNLMTKRRVVINLARWIRGAAVFSGDLDGYRQYAVNHEVGHALGKQHTGCPANDAPAPVMMQQTFGVSNDYVASLNQADPGNSSRVPVDGMTCRPNSWPTPRS
jgi:uncharacterized protein DUF3152